MEVKELSSLENEIRSLYKDILKNTYILDNNCKNDFVKELNEIVLNSIKLIKKESQQWTIK